MRQVFVAHITNQANYFKVITMPIEDLMTKHEAEVYAKEISAKILAEQLASTFKPIQDLTISQDKVIQGVYAVVSKYAMHPADQERIVKFLNSLVYSNNQIREKLNTEVAALEYEALQPEELQ